MPRVADKPPDSAIEELIESDGITLRWNEPNQPARSILICYFLSVVCVTLLWEAQNLLQLVQNQRNQMWCGGCWQFAFIFFFVFHFVHLIGYLRPMVPESITMSHDALRHDTGRAFFINLWSPVHMPNRRYQRLGTTHRRIDAIQTAEIARLVVDRVRTSRRIFYDTGPLRFEIGQFLTEADREWLASVLMAWRTAILGD